MLKISLIVPTYNRAQYLNKSLESFVNQDLDKSSYEIIVVDNNSNDSTREVYNSFSKKYPENNLSYFFEKRQGLHYARNSGIRISKSKIVVFGDDDIEASSAWLGTILKAFEKDNKIGIVGGPVFPIWDKDPPEWIYDYGTKDIHGVFAYLNYGDEAKFLEKGDIYGCNFAITKELAVSSGGSSPDTFPDSMIHYSGRGENDLLDKVRAKKYKVFYDPSASVRHHASVERCTVDYFIGRSKRWAVENVFHLYNSGKSLSVIFLIILRQSIGNVLDIFKQLIFNSKKNTYYYFLIRGNFLLFSWKHYAKLVFSRELQEYTKRQNNLDSA